MSEPVKRRSLLGALDTPPAALPEAAIADTAARHGFAAPPEPSCEPSAPTVRRKRQPTGRIHQFNVRLRAETLDAIYTQANERNIPIAQVIEEAMAALQQKSAD